ncbi:MAG: TetR/AcrR family transcriptional regulator [Acidimicrobiales bacterium]
MKTLERLAHAFERARHEEVDDGSTATRILDAGRQQLELFGIQRTTMEDIARRSGVSRVTVYRHFPNKDRLLEAVLLREVRRFLADLGKLLDGLGSDEERLVEGYLFIVRTLRDHALLQRFLRGEPELFLPQLTTEGGPVIALATRLIAEYMVERDPGLTLEDATVVAELGVRLTVSFVVTPQSTIDFEDAFIVRRFAARSADLLGVLKTKPTRRRE